MKKPFPLVSWIVTIRPTRRVPDEDSNEVYDRAAEVELEEV